MLYWCHFKKSGDKGGIFHIPATKEREFSIHKEEKTWFTLNQKALQRWVVLIVVSLVGGMITKLPYLKDIYFSTLQAATGTTKTQLGLLLTMYGLMNFICYFPAVCSQIKSHQRNWLYFPVLVPVPLVSGMQHCPDILHCWLFMLCLVLLQFSHSGLLW